MSNGFTPDLNRLVLSIHSRIQTLLNLVFVSGFHVDSDSAQIKIGRTSPLTLSSNAISIDASSSFFSVSSNHRTESITAISSYSNTKNIPSTFSDTIVVDGVGTFKLTPMFVNGLISSMTYVHTDDIPYIDKYYTNSTPILSLLNYTYDFEKKDGSSLYVGNIHFHEVTITTDPKKNRLWHFRWGGEIVANKFTTVFQFDPTTTIPIGLSQALITELNFDSAFYSGKQEYIQGHIIINNKSIDISYLRKVFDFTWDQTNAKFTMTLDLTKYDSNWKTLLQWVDVSRDFDPMTFKDYGQQSLFSPNGSNSIYVDIAIRDDVYVCMNLRLYDSFGWTNKSYTIKTYCGYGIIISFALYGVGSLLTSLLIPYIPIRSTDRVINTTTFYPSSNNRTVTIRISPSALYESIGYIFIALNLFSAYLTFGLLYFNYDFYYYMTIDDNITLSLYSDYKFKFAKSIDEYGAPRLPEIGEFNADLYLFNNQLNIYIPDYTKHPAHYTWIFYTSSTYGWVSGKSYTISKYENILVNGSSFTTGSPINAFAPIYTDSTYFKRTTEYNPPYTIWINDNNTDYSFTFRDFYYDLHYHLFYYTNSKSKIYIDKSPSNFTLNTSNTYGWASNTSYNLSISIISDSDDADIYSPLGTFTFNPTTSPTITIPYFSSYQFPTSRSSFNIQYGSYQTSFKKSSYSSNTALLFLTNSSIIVDNNVSSVTINAYTQYGWTGDTTYSISIYLDSSYNNLYRTYTFTSTSTSTFTIYYPSSLTTFYAQYSSSSSIVYRYSFSPKNGESLALVLHSTGIGITGYMSTKINVYSAYGWMINTTYPISIYTESTFTKLYQIYTFTANTDSTFTITYPSFYTVLYVKYKNTYITSFSTSITTYGCFLASNAIIVTNNIYSIIMNGYSPYGWTSGTTYSISIYSEGSYSSLYEAYTFTSGTFSSTQSSFTIQFPSSFTTLYVQYNNYKYTLNAPVNKGSYGIFLLPTSIIIDPIVSSTSLFAYNTYGWTSGTSYSISIYTDNNYSSLFNTYTFIAGISSNIIVYYPSSITTFYVQYSSYKTLLSPISNIVFALYLLSSEIKIYYYNLTTLNTYSLYGWTSGTTYTISTYIDSTYSTLLQTSTFTAGTSSNLIIYYSPSYTTLYIQYSLPSSTTKYQTSFSPTNNGFYGLYLTSSTISIGSSYSTTVFAYSTYGWTSGTSYDIYVYTDSAYSALYQKYTFTAGTSSNFIIYYPSSYTTFYIQYTLPSSTTKYQITFSPVSDNKYGLFLINSGLYIGFLTTIYNTIINVYSTFGWTSGTYYIYVYTDSAYTKLYQIYRFTANSTSSITITYPLSYTTLYIQYKPTSSTFSNTSFVAMNGGSYGLYLTSSSTISIGSSSYSTTILPYSTYGWTSGTSYDIYVYTDGAYSASALYRTYTFTAGTSSNFIIYYPSSYTTLYFRYKPTSTSTTTYDTSFSPTNNISYGLFKSSTSAISVGTVYSVLINAYSNYGWTSGTIYSISIYNKSNSTLLQTFSFTAGISSNFTFYYLSTYTQLYLQYTLQSSTIYKTDFSPTNNGTYGLYLTSSAISIGSSYSTTVFAYSTYGWTSGTSYDIYVYTDSAYSALYQKYTFTASPSSNFTIYYPSSYTTFYVQYSSSTYRSSFSPTNGVPSILYLQSNSLSVSPIKTQKFIISSNYGWTNNTSYSISIYTDNSYNTLFGTYTFTAVQANAELPITYPDTFSNSTFYVQYTSSSSKNYRGSFVVNSSIYYGFLLTDSNLKLVNNNNLIYQNFAGYSTFGWTNGVNYSISFYADGELFKTYTFTADTLGSSASTFFMVYNKYSTVYAQYTTSTNVYKSNNIPVIDNFYSSGIIGLYFSSSYGLSAYQRWGIPIRVYSNYGWLETNTPYSISVSYDTQPLDNYTYTFLGNTYATITLYIDWTSLKTIYFKFNNYQFSWTDSNFGVFILISSYNIMSQGGVLFLIQNYGLYANLPNSVYNTTLIAYGWPFGSYSLYIYLDNEYKQLFQIFTFTINASTSNSSSKIITYPSNIVNTFYARYNNFTTSFPLANGGQLSIFLLSSGINISESQSLTLNVYNTYGWIGSNYTISVYVDSGYTNQLTSLSLTPSSSSTLTLIYPKTYTTLYLQYGSYKTSFTPSNNGTFPLFLINSALVAGSSTSSVYSSTFNAFNTYGWTSISYSISVYTDNAYTNLYGTLSLTPTSSSTLKLYFPSSYNNNTMYLQYGSYKTSISVANAGTYPLFLINSGLFVYSNTSVVYSCTLKAYSNYGWSTLSTSYTIYVYPDSAYTNLYATLSLTPSATSEFTLYFPSSFNTLYLKSTVGTTSYTGSFTQTSTPKSFLMYLSVTGLSIDIYDSSLTFNVYNTYGWTTGTGYSISVYSNSGYSNLLSTTLTFTPSSSTTSITLSYPSAYRSLYLQYGSSTTARTAITPSNATTFSLFLYSNTYLISGSSTIYTSTLNAFTTYGWVSGSTYSINVYIDSMYTQQLKSLSLTPSSSSALTFIYPSSFSTLYIQYGTYKNSFIPSNNGTFPLYLSTSSSSIDIYDSSLTFNVYNTYGWTTGISYNISVYSNSGYSTPLRTTLSFTSSSTSTMTLSYPSAYTTLYLQYTSGANSYKGSFTPTRAATFSMLLSNTNLIIDSSTLYTCTLNTFTTYGWTSGNSYSIYVYVDSGYTIQLKSFTLAPTTSSALTFIFPSSFSTLYVQYSSYKTSFTPINGALSMFLSDTGLIIGSSTIYTCTLNAFTTYGWTSDSSYSISVYTDSGYTVRLKTFTLTPTTSSALTVIFPSSFSTLYVQYGSYKTSFTPINGGTLSLFLSDNSLIIGSSTIYTCTLNAFTTYGWTSGLSYSIYVYTDSGYTLRLKTFTLAPTTSSTLTFIFPSSFSTLYLQYSSYKTSFTPINDTLSLFFVNSGLLVGSSTIYTCTLNAFTTYGWPSGLGNYSISVYIDNTYTTLLKTFTFTPTTSSALTFVSPSSFSTLYVQYRKYNTSFTPNNGEFPLYLISGSIYIIDSSLTFNAYSTYGWSSNTNYSISVYLDSGYTNQLKLFTLTPSSSSTLTLNYPSYYNTLYLQYGSYKTSFTPSNNGTLPLFFINSGFFVGSSTSSVYSCTFNAYSTYGWTTGSTYSISVYTDSAYTNLYLNLSLTPSSNSNLILYFPSSYHNTTIYLKYTSSNTSSVTISNASTFSLFLINPGLLVSSSSIYSCTFNAFSTYGWTSGNSYTISVYLDSVYTNQLKSFTLVPTTNSTITFSFPSSFSTLYLQYGSYKTSFTPINGTLSLFLINSGFLVSSSSIYSSTFNAFTTYGWSSGSSYSISVYLDSMYTQQLKSLSLTPSSSSTLTIVYPSSFSTLYVQFESSQTFFTPTNNGTFPLYLSTISIFIIDSSLTFNAYNSYGWSSNTSHSISFYIDSSYINQLTSLSLTSSSNSSLTLSYPSFYNTLYLQYGSYKTSFTPSKNSTFPLFLINSGLLVLSSTSSVYSSIFNTYGWATGSTYFISVYIDNAYTNLYVILSLTPSSNSNLTLYFPSSYNNTTMYLQYDSYKMSISVGNAGTYQLFLINTGLLQITSSSVSVLSSSQINSFSIDQIKSLSTSVITALTSSAISGLSSSQISSFSITQLGSLATNQIVGLTSSGISGFTSTQIQSLSTSQIAALSSSGVSGLTSLQINSFSTIQIKSLLTNQIAKLTSFGVSGLSSTQIQSLSTNQIQSLSSSAIPGLISSGVSGLSSTQIQLFSINQIQSLSSSAIPGLTSSVISGLSSTQIQSFFTNQIQSLSTSQIAGLSSSGIPGLTSIQIQSFLTNQIQSLSISQITFLSSTVFSGFTSAQINLFSNNQIQSFSTNQISFLSSIGISGLSSTQIQSLSTNQIQSLSSTAIPGLTSSTLSGLSSTQIISLLTLQIKALSSNAISGFTSTQIQSLSTSQITALTTMGVSGLTSLQINSFLTNQIQSLSSNAIPGLTSSALSGLSSNQINSFLTNQIRALSTSAIPGFTSNALSGLSSIQINSFLTNQIQSLSTIAISGLTSNALSALSSIQINSFSTSQIQSLSTNAIPGITSSTIFGLSSTQLNSFLTNQIQSLSTNTIPGITSSTISGLSSTQISAFSVSQINAISYRLGGLTDAVLAAMTTIQVAGLSDFNLLGLSDAQKALLAK